MPYFLIKCLILGDENVGKTSIIHNRTRNQIKQVKDVPMEYVASINSSRSGSPVSGEISTFDFADLNKVKEEDIESTVAKYLTSPYYWEEQGGRYYPNDSSDSPTKPCVLVVFDTTNRSSFEHVQRWVDLAKKYGGDDIYIVLAATKIDQTPKVTKQEAAALAAELKVNLYFINSTARMDKSGVWETLGDMIDETYVRKNEAKAEDVDKLRKQYRAKHSSRCVLS